MTVFTSVFTILYQIQFSNFAVSELNRPQLKQTTHLIHSWYHLISSCEIVYISFHCRAKISPAEQNTCFVIKDSSSDKCLNRDMHFILFICLRSNFVDMTVSPYLTIGSTAKRVILYIYPNSSRLLQRHQYPSVSAITLNTMAQLLGIKLQHTPIG